MTCPPTAFCPDHTGTVSAAGTAAAVFLLLAALLLVLAVAGALAVAVHRAFTRLRPAARRPGPAADDHLVVMAAALDDWWITLDPALPFAGAAAAAHVEEYLASSGYHVVPRLGPLARAYVRLRSGARNAGTRAHASTTPTREYD
ncbi:hypothetical protein AB0G64_09330 [Streptomyces longwoodensis]|uniref:hypothetical protein n=1 Tax=Streptomyces longwoodensis TaxID=68231 RepID=UPI0033D7F5A9